MRIQMDAEAKKFWNMVVIGFIIMAIAAGLGLLIGWGGLVGGISTPVLTAEYALLLGAALVAIIIASTAVGFASYKLTRK